jgi:hypothetical protein
MSSFDKMTVWPVGYLGAFSSWLLRNRKEISMRINTLNAEIARIGHVYVIYNKVQDGESIKATETRVGFSVTPDSTVGKLMQAYIANGGNPLNISSFMHPDSTIIRQVLADGEIIKEEVYPNGGMVSPQSAEYYEPLAQPGTSSGYGASYAGYANTVRDYRTRKHVRTGAGHPMANEINTAMHFMRRWANQEIKERLQDIEWRIIKQCDLKEQLEDERDHILMQSFGGAMSGLQQFQSDSEGGIYNKELLVQVIMQDLWKRVFDINSDGSIRAAKANNEVVFLDFVVPDDVSDYSHPLGA